MRQPPIEELVARTGSRYAAVAIVAVRARQLIAGDLPAIDTNARSPVTIALEELAGGRLRAEIREEDGSPGREGTPVAAARQESAGGDYASPSSGRVVSTEDGEEIGSQRATVPSEA